MQFAYAQSEKEDMSTRGKEGGARRDFGDARWPRTEDETPFGEAQLEGLREATALEARRDRASRPERAVAYAEVGEGDPKERREDFARIFPPLRHPRPHSGRLGARPPPARPGRERAPPGDRAKSEGGGGGGGRKVEAVRTDACSRHFRDAPARSYFRALKDKLTSTSGSSWPRIELIRSSVKRSSFTFPIRKNSVRATLVSLSASRVESLCSSSVRMILAARIARAFGSQKSWNTLPLSRTSSKIVAHSRATFSRFKRSRMTSTSVCGVPIRPMSPAFSAS
jgi:hypothetical protein